MQLAAFIEFLEARSGDSLRAVQWYREENTELIYLRDDLDVADTMVRVDAIHKLLTAETPPEADAKLEALGDRLATVNIYDEAVLINLPFGEDYDVVIGLDPIAGRSLHEFVSGCRASLDEMDSSELLRHH